MKLEQQLLEKLLIKYESSQSFRSETEPRRRIALRLYQGEFKPYDFEDYEQKLSIHVLVKDLKNQGLIDFSWVRGEEDHILDRIWLCLDNLDQAYSSAGRVSPKDDAAAVLQAISLLRSDYEAKLLNEPERINDPSLVWIGDAIEKFESVLASKKRLAAPLPSARELALALMTALRHWLSLCRDETVDLPERVFSLQAFSDSKLFEQQVRPRFASLLRRFLVPRLFGGLSVSSENNSNADFEISDDEAIGLLGLVRSPEVFEFAGALVLKRHNSIIDSSFFPVCAAISSVELPGLQLEIPSSVRQILFVENRTNFHRLTKNRPPEQLLIYHGGCFSPAKGRFFSALQQAVTKHEGIVINHWSDIDLGGFLIFNRLRDNFFPNLQPWHMAEADLLTCLDLAQPIGPAYAQRLQQALTDPQFQPFHPVIRLALTKNVRLEQEAMLGRLV